MNNGHGNGYHNHNGHMSNGYGGGTSNGYGNHAAAGHSNTNGHSAPAPTMTNGHAHMNGHGAAALVPGKNGLTLTRYAHPDMCFYCFDVLYSNLNNVEPPKPPGFTNDAL